METTTDKALVLLEQLAIKLGVTAEHLWEVLIRQAQITAIQYTIFSIFILSAIVTWDIYGINKTRKRNGQDYPDWDGDAVAFVWGSVLLFTGFALGVTIPLMIEAITCFINPEYWALRQILNSI